MSGVPHLIVLLLYGSGLRLLEALRLRVKEKDVDFDQHELTIRVERAPMPTQLAISGTAAPRSQSPVGARRA
jgi:integrase